MTKIFAALLIAVTLTGAMAAPAAAQDYGYRHHRHWGHWHHHWRPWRHHHHWR